jgi:hypothetical protein
MENVQSESRAVERLIRIGKRLAGLSTAPLSQNLGEEFPTSRGIGGRPMCLTCFQRFRTGPLVSTVLRDFDAGLS